MEGKVFNPFEEVSGIELREKTASTPSTEEFVKFLDPSIKQMLSEEGFMRKVIDIRPTVPSEVLTTDDTNQPYVKIPVSSDVKGFINSNFQDVAGVKRVSQRFATLRFGTIRAIETEFSEVEMQILQSRPLIDFKDNIKNNVGEMEDVKLIEALDLAVKTNGKYIDATGDSVFSEKNFRDIKNMIDGDRLRAATMLSSQTLFNDLYLWERNILGSEMTDKRFTENGKNFIDTNKFGPLDVIKSLKENLFVKTYFLKKGADRNIAKPTADMLTTDMYEAEGKLKAGSTTELEKDENGNIIPIVIKRVRSLYMLAEKRMLGTGRELVPYKTTFEKKGDSLKFGGSETIGMILFDRSVAKIDLAVEY